MKCKIDQEDTTISAVLARNIDALMRAKGIRSATKLSEIIRDYGFDLSKAQISRLLRCSSEATTSTLYKLAVGLELDVRQYHLLLSPEGFDEFGRPQIAQQKTTQHQDLEHEADIHQREFIEIYAQALDTAFRCIARTKFPEGVDTSLDKPENQVLFKRLVHMSAQHHLEEYRHHQSDLSQSTVDESQSTSVPFHVNIAKA